MPNLKQAPALNFNGEKNQTNSNNHYHIPQGLADIVFKELGNASAQLRVMLVLIGTKPGFNISEQWILDRTGLQHASYLNARRALEQRGWLSLSAGKAIIVNFDTIYRGNMVLPQNKNEEDRGNMVLPLESNMVLPQRGNMVLPIINKETDNNTNKEDVSPVVEEESPEIKPEGKVSRAQIEAMGCKYTTISQNIIKINDTGKVFELVS